MDESEPDVFVFVLPCFAISFRVSQANNTARPIALRNRWWSRDCCHFSWLPWDDSGFSPCDTRES